tara:strand:+ start:107 stop:571 length:465 start_codon:yes stop_codon:yes gene_type:complete
MLIATSSGKIDISLEETTAEIASELTNLLTKGSTVFLCGEMGVGKTTFVRYLINQYQKKFDLSLTEVPSPTFNILNEYEIDDFTIKHYDLYRLKSLNEVNNLGIFENEKNSIKLIEWPNILLKENNNFIKLTFMYSKDYLKRELSYENLIKNEN